MHAYYANEIATINNRLDELERWTRSARRDALIADLRDALERVIESAGEYAEIGAQCAEVIEESATETVEVSGALDRAMTAAHKTGCAIVKGAARMGAELERHAPGCLVQRGPVKVWTVYADGGEYRLVVRDGSFNGAMHWMAR